MQSFVSYFGCGISNVISDRDMCEYTCQKFLDNLTRIIPFFRQYPILGCKSLDFKDFSSISELIKNGAHYNKEGLDLIFFIKSNMNTDRVQYKAGLIKT